MYLNKNRTEGLWLNNLVNARLGGIKWSKQIKALGIWFGIDKSKCENLNWEMKIVQCKNLIYIYIWNKRLLTICGTFVVIKSILLPKFKYLIQSCVITKHVTKQISLMLLKFLWGRKNEKIKREIKLINNTEGVGINMIDFIHFVLCLK